MSCKRSNGYNDWFVGAKELHFVCFHSKNKHFLGFLVCWKQWTIEFLEQLFADIFLTWWELYAFENNQYFISANVPNRVINIWLHWALWIYNSPFVILFLNTISLPFSIWRVSLSGGKAYSIPSICSFPAHHQSSHRLKVMTERLSTQY